MTKVNTVSAKLLASLAIMAAAAFAFAQAPAPAAPAAPAAAPAQAAPAAGLLEPKPLTPGHKVVVLFPPDHPTLQNRQNVAGWGTDENLRGQPGRISAATNIHNPSIELYLAPPEKANGVSVILSAGGGNTSENVGPEGTQVATWLNSLGVSCFVHRYRLRPYTSDGDALLDTQRAVRVIRANAKEWNIDPNKIGHMGFSAGGEQSARLEINYDKGNPDAADPIDRVSCRPDWTCLVYAGWANGSFNMTKIPGDAPPIFMVCAGTDDMFHSKQTVEFYTALTNVGQNFKPSPLNVEMHIYGKGSANPTNNSGGHGGGIGARRGIPYGTWQYRFVDWITDMGVMPKAAATPAAAR